MLHVSVVFSPISHVKFEIIGIMSLHSHPPIACHKSSHLVKLNLRNAHIALSILAIKGYVLIKGKKSK